MVVTLLQACHHGLTGDGAKLVGEGAVEDQDVHREDPLADGCSVLKDEALVDEEDAAWRRRKLRRTNISAVGMSKTNPIPISLNSQWHKKERIKTIMTLNQSTI